MDVHVRQDITDALRQRNVDVLTAQEDGAARIPDPELLDRAMSCNRVLFSQDKDLLREAAYRQRTAISFFGLVYAHQLNITDREATDDLEIIAKVYEPEDIANRVVYLPLK